MSIDRSLKVKGALTRHRNVLKRDERIERLKEEERWTDEDSLFGLPKVAHRKSHAGKKAKEEVAAAAVEGVPGVTAGEAAPTSEATAAKPEAGKKAAEKTAAAKPATAAKSAAGKPAAKPAAGKKEKK
jgi:small basic protein (TIGR04137 family)